MGEDQVFSVRMSNLFFYKSFILTKVLQEIDVLPLKFYNNLKPGSYLGLKIITLNSSLKFFGKLKNKSGFYNNGLLCYSPSEKLFFILLPCFYTSKKMKSLTSLSSEEQKVVHLVKKINFKGVRCPSPPVWSDEKLKKYFEPFTQFFLFDVSSYEDENAGKIRKTLKRDLKYYLNFVRELKKNM